MRDALKNNYFWLGMLLLCFSYLGFQIFYTYFASLSVDEFWFAHWTHRYGDGLPYRDFSPYKTTLGYYLLLIPMSLSKNFLTPLFYTKNALALLNATIFFISGWWLKKFFPKIAILTGIALLICAEFVLSYSTNIRVDFLAYWFCFISVMLLLEKKYLLAGVIIALGFLTSQKALWYMVASNAALGLTWLCFDRDWKNLCRIVLYNLALILSVVAYIAFWTYFSSIKTVLHNMFYEAFIMYQLDWYSSARITFWTVTITYSPLLFLLWPLTLLSLIVKPQQDPLYKIRFFCITYMAVIMLCLIPFKQIFPYYMMTTIPAFMLGYTAFFAWLYSIFKNDWSLKILLIGTHGVWLFLFCYFVGLLWAIDFFNLPSSYTLVALVPLLLGVYITKLPLTISKEIRAAFPQLLLLTMLFIGFIYPLIVFSTLVLPERDGHYQKYTLNLANLLLQDNSDYVAGIELFYNKNQPIPGMQHLDGPAINYLYNPSKKLLPVMLDSLYHSRASKSQVIEALQNSHVKFYINNYRMNALPPVIKNYLASQYEHFSGSIYLYAPAIHPDQINPSIRFNGNYQIKSQDFVLINGKKIIPNEIIKLKAGKFNSAAKLTYRLKLIPEHLDYFLDPKFQKDVWEKVLS